MSLATCYPCAKYLLLVLNLFFWLSGLSIIALGIYSLLRPEVRVVIHLFNFATFPLSSIEILACTFVLFGLLIFLIGLFGYCGAKRESRTCLILYIVLVVCALLAELGLFIFVAMSHDRGEVFIKEHLVSQMKTYNHMYPNRYEKAIDYVQSKYHCCGMISAHDYNEAYIPLSCCSMTSTAVCTVEQVGATGAPGCYSSLSRMAFFWGKFLLLFELTLCALALIGMFLAICVCQNTMIYDGYTQTSYRI